MNKPLTETLQSKPAYWVVARTHPGYFSRKGKEYKYLCRPKMGQTRWSWSRKIIRAARFQDADQAEAYAKDYEGSETMRFSDGI